jgi:hypothetical protein
MLEITTPGANIRLERLARDKRYSNIRKLRLLNALEDLPLVTLYPWQSIDDKVIVVVVVVHVKKI